MSRGCRAEASRLLDFYVNGSLRDSERHGVSRHLAACAECSREVAEIEALAQSLPEAPPGILERPARRTPWLLAVAAAVVAAAALGIWIESRPGAPPTIPATRVATLDLGAGGERGASTPAASITRDVAFVEARFSLTVDPGASYDLRLLDPRGERVFGPVSVAPWDALGSSLQRFPAAVFAATGEYSIEVEERLPGGAIRRYGYAFTVRVVP